MKITGNRNWKTLAYDAIHLMPALAYLLWFLLWTFAMACLYAPAIQAALLGQEVGDSIYEWMPPGPPIIVFFTFMFLSFLFSGVSVFGSIISMVVDMIQVKVTVESAHRSSWMLLLLAFQPAASLAFWYQHRQKVYAALT